MENHTTFFIDGSMGKLNARLDLPELGEGQKCDLVIFCHGLGGNLDFHLWPLLMVPLNEHGIGILRFDFNGCGKSEGQFQDMTVSNEIDDLLNVIAYARKMPITSSISLLGHSQGGVVAGMTAGRCGANQIRSIVLLSAAAVLRDDALRGSTQAGQSLEGLKNIFNESIEFGSLSQGGVTNGFYAFRFRHKTFWSVG